MGFYTIIMEFKGGTYISQLICKDEYNGVITYIKKLRFKDVSGLTKKIKRDWVKELLEDDTSKPVSLKNLKNVWCTFLHSSNKSSCLINIIKTQKQY